MKRQILFRFMRFWMFVLNKQQLSGKDVRDPKVRAECKTIADRVVKRAIDRGLLVKLHLKDQLKLFAGAKAFREPSNKTDK